MMTKDGDYSLGNRVHDTLDDLINEEIPAAIIIGNYRCGDVFDASVSKSSRSAFVRRFLFPQW